MNPFSSISRTLLGDGSGGRRAGLAIGALALVGAVWGLSQWAATPTYVPLYRDLELKEAGSMAERLKKAGIDHRLGDGGSALEVPASEARDGMPSGGRPGLELFDKSSWGMTDFTQRVTYQRALEGELARTIAGIRGIEKAQVHLVLNAPGTLRRAERPAGAAVVVTLAAGQALAPETVEGITYLVSNSVEELSSDNVAVLDDAGRVLSAPASGGGSGSTNRQLELARTVESHLSTRIEALLATTLGVGAARAQVAASLGFDQVDRTTDTFDPEGGVLSSEQRGETTAESTEGGETVIHNQYLNSRKVEKVVSAVGSVQRLSVAVMVDEKALAAALPGDKEAALLRLDTLVRDAVGIDSTRGDRLSLVAVPFRPVTVGEAGIAATAGSSGPGEMLIVAERVSRPAVGIVGLVVLVLLAFRLLRAPVAGTGAPATAPGAPAGGSNGVPDGGPGGNGADLAHGRRRIAALANEKPQATADVLRGWLTESS